MALCIPVVQMHDIRTAVRTGPVKRRCFLGGREPERALPFPLSVELICIGISVRCLMANQLHEPLRCSSFDLKNDLAFQLTQPVVREKEGDEDRRDADGDKPFVADVAGGMKREALLRKLAIKLLNERLE